MFVVVTCLFPSFTLVMLCSLVGYFVVLLIGSDFFLFCS